MSVSERYVAGVNELGTQSDDVINRDIVMPLERQFEKKRDLEVTVAFYPESDGFVILLQLVLAPWCDGAHATFSVLRTTPLQVSLRQAPRQSLH